ncbi:MAG: DUF1638 domain-containing protein [Armatimonadota bacterium]
MKLKVIACGVFEPYLKYLAEKSENDIDIKILDAGLHSRPNDLRLLTQSEIDKASKSGKYDAIILVYGLCGRGIANIESRDIPLVIPRAHDCITLFLGSQEAYLKQFSQNPGTFYHTMGWIKQKINPKNKDASSLYINYNKDGFEKHPEYNKYEQLFGKDNAEHIVSFMERWRQHYTRAAYIDLGFPNEDEYKKFTQNVADILGWNHDVLKGDSELLENLLNGNWHSDKIVVIPPRGRSIATGDDKIIDVVLPDQDNSQPFTDTEVILESIESNVESSGIGLGIDAGGTYTDAVIYDIAEKKILSKAKSLTTYHNLLEGIRGAISQLPSELLEKVNITSLSTTLATNSIVEGRGYKVGLIVLAPWNWFAEEIDHKPFVWIKGSTTIGGSINEPLDEDAARNAVEILIKNERCSALVVAGYATVRNPQQANRVREIIMEMYPDVPVVCSHELSRRLNAIHGAQTALANARLLPVISELIKSVHQAMKDFNIKGRLMVVKGDGTPVDEHIAKTRPVETILSGPAASVSGAKILTGLDSALVMDIGGTTTDCAIIEDGLVAMSPEGARIGSWVMAVDAVEICTVGHGGDSRIDFSGDRQIKIGPMRNIPFSYLCSEYESVYKFLKNFNIVYHIGETDASSMDVLVAGSSISIDLTAKESELLDLLKDGPIPATLAAHRLDVPSPALLPLNRLETSGIVKRASLTPTDLMHVTGRFDRWSKEGASLALDVFSALYGKPSNETLEILLTAITRRLFEEAVRREVSSENRKITEIPESWKFIVDKAFNDDGKGLAVNFTLRRPIVAIGAPSEAMMFDLDKHLNAEIIIPEHADVANAVGAIGTEITVKEEILIRPGQMSNYVLYGTDERLEFSELKRATEKAVSLSKYRAINRAIDSGAANPNVVVSSNDQLGTTSDGGKVFLERRVIATAFGPAFGNGN